LSKGSLSDTASNLHRPAKTVFYDCSTLSEKMGGE
jgi:hypothetical protein